MKMAVDFRGLEVAATPALGSTDPGTIITQALIYILPIAGFVLLFYLIWAGYQYMTSAGDPKSLQQARNNITYAVVGFIVVAAAYGATAIFGTALGLQGIMSIFPRL